MDNRLLKLLTRDVGFPGDPEVFAREAKALAKADGGDDRGPSAGDLAQVYLRTLASFDAPFTFDEYRLAVDDAAFGMRAEPLPFPYAGFQPGSDGAADPKPFSFGSPERYALLLCAQDGFANLYARRPGEKAWISHRVDGHSYFPASTALEGIVRDVCKYENITRGELLENLDLGVSGMEPPAGPVAATRVEDARAFLPASGPALLFLAWDSLEAFLPFGNGRVLRRSVPSWGVRAWLAPESVDAFDMEAVKETVLRGSPHFEIDGSCTDPGAMRRDAVDFFGKLAPSLPPDPSAVALAGWFTAPVIREAVENTVYAASLPARRNALTLWDVVLADE